MPLVPLKFVVSFTSQDARHPVENILHGDGTSLRWLSAPGHRTGLMEAIFQLEQPSQITHLDIGTYCAACVQILVGQSSWPQTKEYKTLVPTLTLMTALDCRMGNNKAGMRMLKYDNFDATCRDETWDRVKVVLSQPFRKDLQFGLSVLRITSSDPARARSSSGGDKASSTAQLADNSSGLKNSREIEKLFFGKEAKKRSDHIEGVKKNLLKISGSSEYGSEQESSLSRTSRLVLAAAGKTPQYKYQPSASLSSGGGAIIKKLTKLPFEEEVDNYLSTIKIKDIDLDTVTVASLRHGLEKIKWRKLSKEEKLLFFKKTQEFMENAFEKMDILKQSGKKSLNSQGPQEKQGVTLDGLQRSTSLIQQTNSNLNIKRLRSPNDPVTRTPTANLTRQSVQPALRTPPTSLKRRDSEATTRTPPANLTRQSVEPVTRTPPTNLTRQSVEPVTRTPTNLTRQSVESVTRTPPTNLTRQSVEHVTRKPPTNLTRQSVEPVTRTPTNLTRQSVEHVMRTPPTNLTRQSVEPVKRSPSTNLTRQSAGLTIQTNQLAARTPLANLTRHSAEPSSRTPAVHLVRKSLEPTGTPPTNSARLPLEPTARTSPANSTKMPVTNEARQPLDVLKSKSATNHKNEVKSSGNTGSLFSESSEVGIPNDFDISGSSDSSKVKKTGRKSTALHTLTESWSPVKDAAICKKKRGKKKSGQAVKRKLRQFLNNLSQLGDDSQSQSPNFEPKTKRQKLGSSSTTGKEALEVNRPETSTDDVWLSRSSPSSLTSMVIQGSDEGTETVLQSKAQSAGRGCRSSQSDGEGDRKDEEASSPLVMCPICSNPFMESVIQEHAAMCGNLDDDNNTCWPPSPVAPSMDRAENWSTSQMNTPTDILSACPICGVMLPLLEINTHVNFCLDS